MRRAAASRGDAGQPARAAADGVSLLIDAAGAGHHARRRRDQPRVGRDLSIIAHDDVLPHLLAENFAPPLTVTRLPIRDAGPILAQMMVARMAGTPARDLQRTDKVDLIVRGSTGPVPKWGNRMVALEMAGDAGPVLGISRLR